MKRTRRSGFSLLEVMLATTVLLGSVIVLSHISFVGTAHMDAAEQYAAAQLVCQTRMNEMLAGAVAIEEVSGQAIPELPGWGLSVKVESASEPGLLALEVTAAEQPTEGTLEGSVEGTAAPAAANQPVEGAGKRFTLVRWIADPSESQSATNLTTDDSSVPADVPTEPSLFGDTSLPGEPILPEEPVFPDAGFAPGVPELPEEPPPFDEPMPEF